MYLRLIGAGVGALIGALFGLVFAGSPKDPEFQLRGDRFQPLTYSEMTPEQKMMTQHILSGERGTMDGPYNVLLRSPEMGDLAQKFGANPFPLRATEEIK